MLEALLVVTVPAIEIAITAVAMSFGKSCAHANFLPPAKITRPLDSLISHPLRKVPSLLPCAQ